MRLVSLSIGLLALIGACSDSNPGTPVAAPLPLAAPPAPASGYQIPFGPFDVTPEVQLCRTLKLPNDDIEAFDRLWVSMSQGSHHFIIFRSRLDYPDQVFPCFGTVNFDEWDFMMDVNKSGGLDWQLQDGQAFILQPHQQLMIQSHFVNATTVKAPEGGMVYLNLYKIPLEQVKHELRGLFTVNTRIKIPPNSTYTTTKKCTPSRDINIVALTGHFHARGTEFLVEKTGLADTQFAADTDLGTVYDDLFWDSPLFAIYTPPVTINGGLQSLQFTCSYDNTNPSSITFNQTIGFGAHADVQEHCNLFFQYYEDHPHDEPLRCVEGSGGW